MPSVRAVITSPFHNQLKWLPPAEYKETVYLSKDSSEQDAILFLNLLCGYNHINVDDKEPSEIVQELLLLDEAILSGGLAFTDKDKEILPSCCCGLEGWREVYEDIVAKSNPWLGHDPSPTIEYGEEWVRVWSDDPFDTEKKDLSNQQRDKLFYVEFRYNELINKVQSMELDLLDFYTHAFDKLFPMIDLETKKQLFSKYCEWFHLRKAARFRLIRFFKN
ncbi:hypothetical protein [Brevibacillus sp. NRS-1366]|uniref:hypothetical protein n=1 Tax=Brevibacillus sp. NRS-1366 TaxID=3233899 RepID=UPI003D1E828D